LLSLDPLRDPKGILLILDKHALTVSRGGNVADEVKTLQWLIRLVESEAIALCYRDSGQTYRCGLLELPNFSYSYSLALFLLHQASELTAVEVMEGEDIKQKADDALQTAISRYPLVVDLLLKQLETDTTGRSFRRDWVTVLDFAKDRGRQLAREWHSQSSNDTVALSATMQACDLVIQIFVQQNASLWGRDDVQQWLYENLKVVQSKAAAGELPLPSTPNSAIMRYGDADPNDYDTKIQTLPPEAAPIDPGLVAHALQMDRNRRRLIRNNNGRQAGEQQQDAFEMLDANGIRVQQRQHLLGPPTHHVDPDWPFLEVFWRSFLPWNHVDGVPPPRR